MAIKFTKNTLDKLRSLYEEIGFKVIFEKGNFQSGYCLLKDKQIAVVNRFLPLEGRIQAMLDILPQVDVNQDDLSGDGQKLYEELLALHA